MPERRWLDGAGQRRPVDLEDRRAHRHEVADGVAEHDQAGVTASEGGQACGVDGLDGARPGRAQDERRCRRRSP